MGALLLTESGLRFKIAAFCTSTAHQVTTGVGFQIKRNETLVA